MLSRATRKLKNYFKFVVFRCLVPFFGITRKTTMKNSIPPIFKLHAHWLHKPLAYGLTIAGVNINVFTPKATRTMVGITTSLHNKTALFANKIFFCTLKFLCHYKVKVEWRWRESNPREKEKLDIIYGLVSVIFVIPRSRTEQNTRKFFSFCVASLRRKTKPSLIYYTLYLYETSRQGRFSRLGEILVPKRTQERKPEHKQFVLHLCFEQLIKEVTVHPLPADKKFILLSKPIIPFCFIQSRL